jgi:hypothetical protein
MFEVPHFSLKYLFNSLHIDSISGIKAGIIRMFINSELTYKFVYFQILVRTDTDDELQFIVKVFI